MRKGKIIEIVSNRGRKFYDIRDAIQHSNEVQTLEQIQREHLMDAEARRRKLVELQIRIYNNPYLRGRRAKR